MWAEQWPSAPRWGAVKRRADLRAESTWHFLGLAMDVCGTKSLLRGLESFPRAASGQLDGAKQS